MKVDKTEIKENSDRNFCVYLSTVDDSYDAQIYSILKDPKNIFRVEGSKLCLSRKADFEEKPTRSEVMLTANQELNEFNIFERNCKILKPWYMDILNCS